MNCPIEPAVDALSEVYHRFLALGIPGVSESMI